MGTEATNAMTGKTRPGILAEGWTEPNPASGPSNKVRARASKAGGHLLLRLRHRLHTFLRIRARRGASRRSEDGWLERRSHEYLGETIEDEQQRLSLALEMIDPGADAELIQSQQLCATAIAYAAAATHRDHI